MRVMLHIWVPINTKTTNPVPRQNRRSFLRTELNEWTNNTATFNSGHDTKSGVWHPFLMAIHGFPLHILVGFCSVNILTKFHTCRCNTFKDIAPLITKPYRVLVGIPSLSQIPTKTLQGFFPYREKIPYREIKSLLLIQCREKIPVGFDSLQFWKDRDIFPIKSCNRVRIQDLFT